MGRLLETHLRCLHSSPVSCPSLLVLHVFMTKSTSDPCLGMRHQRFCGIRTRRCSTVTNELNLCIGLDC